METGLSIPFTGTISFPPSILARALAIPGRLRPSSAPLSFPVYGQSVLYVFERDCHMVAFAAGAFKDRAFIGACIYMVCIVQCKIGETFAYASLSRGWMSCTLSTKSDTVIILTLSSISGNMACCSRSSAGPLSLEWYWKGAIWTR